MEKFFNNAIIGNKNIVASCTERGELQRFCYPSIDGKQFVDYFHTGLKINDSNIVYLHDDINNVYKQKYEKNTNVLITEIENSYFKLGIEQMDCVLINRDIFDAYLEQFRQPAKSKSKAALNIKRRKRK